MEGDLLGADRPDEHLERVRRERRAQAGKRRDDPREHRLGRGERVERIEVELGAEEPGDLACDELVPGSIRAPPGAASIGDLPPVEHAVEPAVLVQVGRVGAEGAETLGRQLPAEGLGDRDEHALRVDRRALEPGDDSLEILGPAPVVQDAEAQREAAVDARRRDHPLPALGQATVEIVVQPL